MAARVSVLRARRPLPPKKIRDIKFLPCVIIKKFNPMQNDIFIEDRYRDRLVSFKNIVVISGDMTVPGLPQFPIFF
jgi:hypothetical protein